MAQANLHTEPDLNLTIPEPGQLVEVRRRQWVVSEVIKSHLSSGDRNPQHLVDLNSLDEDALGEELRVIWELEAGAHVLERAGLPKITGYDSNDRLEAFLDAVRWGAVTSADRNMLQAPFRSGITIEDYQLDPLVRAIEMARVNLLIADDVGLGKTIEAGLVIQEMLVRHRARTVWIVCPANLTIKWQDEMLEKFGLDFKIVDTEYIKQHRRERGIHVNPWTSYPRLIASMDWMKSGEGLRLIKDALPHQITYPRAFDILVVDEAHNVAPSTSSRYAIESLRTKLIRKLSPHFNHRLFLSATPHNGYQESFTSLLELLDDQRFARTVMPDEQRLRSVMVRRLKSDIVDSNGMPVFPKRVLKTLEVDYTEEEKRIHRKLQEYVQDRAVTVKGTRFEYGSEFVHTLLKKRLFSSPRAFATTLAKHRETLSTAKAKKSDSKFEDRILRKAIQKTEEESSSDDFAEEALEDAVTTVGELAPALTEKQRQQLDQLKEWADRAKNQADSKAKSILGWLDQHLRPQGSWNDKRVILFTEYRATQSWLEQILANHGFAGDRLRCIHGGTPSDEREQIKAAFQAQPKASKIRILLATDAASEGIDLQNHCNYMIHVEIPWNPNVMEQRNGRIDRHGQKQKEVLIWHPVGKGFVAQSDPTLKPGSVSGDQEYLMRAVQKINSIREDLGSVGPVIARQIEEAMLGKRKTLDTAAAENQAAKTKKFVAAEKQLQEKIARLHDRLLETKQENNLSPAHLIRAVQVGFELAEKPALIPNPNLQDTFEVPHLSGSWGRATTGLEHPHTQQRRPITFDHEIAKGRDDVVLAHLNHRLVRMSLRLLREELWKLDDVKQLHRVTFKRMLSRDYQQPVAIVWSRLVITGGDQRRLHEELTFAGGELRKTGFSRITQIGRLQSLLNSSEPIEPSQRIFDELKARFENQEASVISAVNARSRDRLNSLENSLKLKQQREVAEVTRLLEELANGIRSELGIGQTSQQLELFSPEEVGQIRKDKAALQARLDRIPGELEQETKQVIRHYANPVDRTFPAAVVFLIPQNQF